MRVSRKFVIEEHEEYGMIGLRPLDMPHADPLTGIAIPHDILEHFPGDDGGIEAELMALGASWHLRGETGYYQEGGNVNSAEKHIASDFDILFTHYADEEFSLIKAPPMTEAPPHDYAEEGLRECVRLGLKYIREMGQDEQFPEEFKRWSCDEYRETLYKWLALGFVKARDRYADFDTYTLAHTAYPEIQRVADDLCTEDNEGQTVEIGFDCATMRVFWSEIYTECAGCGGEPEEERFLCEECQKEEDEDV